MKKGAWSRKEESVILNIGRMMTVDELSIELDRSPKSIEKKASLLGIPLKSRKGGR